MVDVSKR